MLLELSHELGKQERQEEPGRQRAGVSGKEKKVRKKEKEKQEQRGSWKDIRKMSGPQHLENRLGAIFRLP